MECAAEVGRESPAGQCHRLYKGHTMKTYFNYCMQAKTVTGEALVKIAALANIREIHRQEFYSEMHFVWARAQYEFILYSNARRIVTEKSPLLKAAQALRESISGASRNRKPQLRPGVCR